MITSKDYDANIISEGLQFQIDAFYQPKEQSLRNRINMLTKALSPQPGENILDVGCGVGTFAFHCARLGAKALGIDYSRESIKAARELCLRFGVKQNAHFLIANATALPLQTSCFDKIVAADFIEHIFLEEKEKLLREMRRVLKPQGRVVIFTPNLIREKIGSFYWKLRNILFGHKIPINELHYGLINAAEVKRICKKNNFKCRLFYKDLTRPYLASIPLLRRVLALNLLFIVEKA